MLHPRLYFAVPLVGCTLAIGCTTSNQASTSEASAMTENPTANSIQATPSSDQAQTPTVGEKTQEIATFGAGCFWCVEAVFKELEGVVSVESGYTGGHVVNPTYEEVCGGRTGHAEVCRITFDPARIAFDELLEVFWQTHDPTTPNQQGSDRGPQYRSAIFYHSQRQKELAEKYKKALDESGAFRAPIVTEITAAKVFYKAEDYHQDYYALNSYQPYCAYVVKPKVDKVRKVFKDKLKKATEVASPESTNGVADQ